MRAPIDERRPGLRAAHARLGRWAVLVALAAAGLSACAARRGVASAASAGGTGVARAALTEAPGGQLEGTVVRHDPSAEPLTPRCAGADAETCDGRDDDCDGRIDEGCAYAGGVVQVTLAWKNGADLDLYVRDPTGDVVSFQRTRSPSGGELTASARGACGIGTTEGGVESASWYADAVPHGKYEVIVQYWGACLSGAGLTEATVSVGVGGAVIAAYRIALMPTQRARVVDFEVR